MKRDAIILFATRVIRMFAYGFLSVVLVVFLAQNGLSEHHIGLLLTLTLVGDAAISLWMTTGAHRFGKKRMLLIGSLLMVFAGVMFVLTQNFFLLVFAAIFGIISPSGKEIGPFLSIEQAALSQLLPDHHRTRMFAWYHLSGSFATALGALSGGCLAQGMQLSGYLALYSYRAVLIGYAVCGVLLAVLFVFLSSSVEAQTLKSPNLRRPSFGLHVSRGIVLKLSALFALDAFAGGFVVESIMAYWFHVKFGADIGTLGGIFFGANLLAGISALLATRIAKRIGLVNTMILTHLPSNLLLCCVPLMPTLPLAIGLLLIRYSISQMDVPTRQSYTMAVVSPDERTAASGVTTIARSVGASLSPALTGALLANPLLLSVPFFLSGGLKIVYDLLLYRSFKSLSPPEEQSKR